MEVEFVLGSGKCSDATSDYDEESGAMSSDTAPAVAFGSPTGLELDLGDSPPATGLGMDSVLSLGPPAGLNLADGPPGADSELELVLPTGSQTDLACSFAAGPRLKRRRVLAHTEPCAGIVASVAAATPATKVSSRGSFLRGSGSEYGKHDAFRRDNGLVDAQGRWTYSQALRALENALPLPLECSCS